MSRTIDERIVEMRFDNRQFEQNVQTSLSTLDKLKRGLDLETPPRALTGLGTRRSGATCPSSASLWRRSRPNFRRSRSSP